MSFKNNLKKFDNNIDKQQLAVQLLTIVGIHKMNEEYYIVNEDISKKKEQVQDLLLQTCLTLSVPERKRLYKINEIRTPELSIAHAILKSAGHPLKRTKYPCPEEGIPAYRWKISSKYTLDPNLIPLSIVVQNQDQKTSVSIPILCDA